MCDRYHERRLRRHAICLELSLLEAAWNVPATPPVYDLQDALRGTRTVEKGSVGAEIGTASGCKSTYNFALSYLEDAAEETSLLEPKP